jgi:hypothetical protein
MQILTELPHAHHPDLKTPKHDGSIMTHDNLLKQELTDFYSGTDFLRRMSAIINGKRLSLRLLDWFVCNYSKEYFTIFRMKRGETENVRFIVYIDYKTNLDIYSKKRFAPFCRHDRVYVPYDEENYMETTIGQLNFFRWVFKNKILEYIEANYDDIKRDMDARNTSRKKRNTSGSSMDSAVTDTESSETHGVSEEKKMEVVVSDSVPDFETSYTKTDALITEWVAPSYPSSGPVSIGATKTRKKREELSSSACRSMRCERADITIKFGV